ncbi:MAG: hypothetical protein AB1641_14805 [Thermodesulfobacteriota bacterium]
MPREEIRPSSEIDAYCTKCKLVTNHRVVALDKGVIKRVICLTCQSQHNFRLPPGQKAPRTQSARRVIKDEVRLAGPGTQPFKKWLELKESLNQTACRDYRMSEAYNEGQAINHSRFGLGFVTKLLDRQKMQVMFEKEIKMLAMNYSPGG